MARRVGRENTPASIALLLILLLALGLGGYQIGGPLGGLFGALVATSIALVGTASYRAVSRGDFRTERAISLDGLDARQSLAVLGQHASNVGGPEIRSAVLDGIAEVEELAADDFPSARLRAEALMREHPRSPAVPAGLARLLRQRQDGRADAMSSVAIELAIVGGMNALAVRCYDECPEPERDRLELASSTWRALGRALCVRERASDAEFAAAQADAVAPDQDERLARRRLETAAAAFRTRGDDAVADALRRKLDGEA